MNRSVLQAAYSWIDEIQKKKKLNKQARTAVVSFAIWLDSLIEDEEIKQEIIQDEKN